jgi:hypothetical protein
MVTVLCNDSEIEVEDGVVCEICGLELEEFRPGDWHRDSWVLSLDMRYSRGIENSVRLSHPKQTNILISLARG